MAEGGERVTKRGINKKPETLCDPKLKIETCNIEDVLPYAKNARLHSDQQVAIIAASIKEFGFVNPCLVDASGTLIAGHGRVLASKLLGAATVPVIRLGHLTEDQVRALRIADNAIPLTATWSAELIHAELGDLKAAGFDLQLFGFPETQLRQFGILSGTDSEQDPEAVPEPPKNPVVRKGDLWILGDHRLLCGDSTNADDARRSLGGAKPHLMVTDPPYGVEYDPEWRLRAKVTMNKKKLGKVQNDSKCDWRETWALFAGDIVYCWHADRHASEVQVSLEASGFQVVGQIIWAKDRLALSRGDYHWQHEPCWYLVRKGANHKWAGGRSQTTLWQIPQREDSGHGHGTQKPIECMKRPIENNSQKGDSVYEPFAGSGTTIIAAEMTGRKCLAIEIDESYVQVCIERWEKFTGRKALLDGKTLEQVAKGPRRTGKAKSDDHAAGDSGEPVSRIDAAGNGSKRPVRKSVHARRAPPKRKPARESLALAGDS